MLEMKSTMDKELNEAQERCELMQTENLTIKEEREQLRIRVKMISEVNESRDS
jgi:hypothetical protein